MTNGRALLAENATHLFPPQNPSHSHPSPTGLVVRFPDHVDSTPPLRRAPPKLGRLPIAPSSFCGLAFLQEAALIHFSQTYRFTSSNQLGTRSGEGTAGAPPVHWAARLLEGLELGDQSRQAIRPIHTWWHVASKQPRCCPLFDGAV